MKKFIYTLLLVSVSLAANAQRDVYWLHGLNETGVFWQRYSTNITDPGNTGGYEVYRPQWWSGSAIQTVATEVNTTVNNDSPSSNVILIGHSTGGLIARSMRQTNSKINAIITIGTPNQGAGIVDAIRDGTYENIISKAKSKMTGAVNKSLVALTVFTSLFSGTVSGTIAMASGLTNTAGFIGFNVMDLLLNGYVNNFNSNTTVTDMRTNSTYINGINSGNIPVPIINIMGNEDDWQAIRLLGSIANQTAIESMANTTDRTYDEEYFGKIQVLSSTLDQLASKHQDTYTTLGWVMAFTIPPGTGLWATRELIKSAGRTYSDLKRMVNIDMHTEWSKIIKSYHYETHTYYIVRPDPDVIHGGNPDYDPGNGNYPDPNEPVLDPLVVHEITQTVLVNDPHDGLIGNWHSRIPEGKGAYVSNVVVPHVNHMEMNGHIEVHTLLETLIDGTDYTPVYGKLFNPENN